MQEQQLFDSRYILFSNGTIYSVTRDKFLSTKIDSSGYPACNLWDGYRYHKLRVHTLIAKYFIPNPKNKRTVNHKDGDKTNNNISNLEWATDSENLKHAHDNIKRKSTRKLSFEELRHILFSTDDANTVASLFGVSAQHIRAIRRGKYIVEYLREGNPLPETKGALCH